MSELDGRDYSQMSDTEALDPAQYSIFPNIVIFRSLGFPYLYRFLPMRDDPHRTYFDFMIFRPKPRDGSPIPEARHLELGPDDTYSAMRRIRTVARADLRPGLRRSGDGARRSARGRTEGPRAGEVPGGPDSPPAPDPDAVPVRAVGDGSAQVLGRAGERGPHFGHRWIAPQRQAAIDLQILPRHEAMSLASHNAAFAISSTVPMRPSG